MPIQCWGFLVIMFMVQNSEFTILTLCQISVISCLMFKPLYTAIQTSRPFFPIWHHSQSCRGGIPPSQPVFFSQFIPKCILNSWPFLWSNTLYIMSPVLSRSSLKTVVSRCRGCHCIESPSGAQLHFLTRAPSATSALLMCFVWLCLLLWDDVNLPCDQHLYHTLSWGRCLR